MSYARTSPELLAETILANLGREPTYPPIPTDGARVAARLIAARFLGGARQRRGQAESRESELVGAA